MASILYSGLIRLPMHLYRVSKDLSLQGGAHELDESSREQISSALLKLSRKPWGYDSPIYGHLKDFGDAIEYLSMFVGCIRHWNDALLPPLPDLDFLTNRIAASLKKIEGEFMEELKRDERASVLKAVSFNLFGSYKVRAPIWICFFENSKDMIDDLKRQIAEACVSIVYSVKNNFSFSVLDLHKWKQFLKFMPSYFSLSVDYPRQLSITEIRLTMALLFLCDILKFLERYNRKNPNIEAFLVKVGRSIISAGMLNCQWWAKNFHPSMKEDVDDAIRCVEWEIGLTNPFFIDFILKELKAHGKSSSIALKIVERLFLSLSPPYTGKESSVFSNLDTELKYLVTTVLDMPEEGTLLYIFMADIKQLIRDIASHHHSLIYLKDRNVITDLVGNVCLMKVEIFLRTQLATANFLTSKKPIGFLNQVVSEMELVISLSEGEEIERTKFANQILMLLKEVVTDVQRYQQSAISLHLKSPVHEGINKGKLIRSLLLKTLLLKGDLLFMKIHDTLLPSFKDRIEALHEGFRIMLPLAIKVEEFIVPGVEKVAINFISLYHQMLHPEQMSHNVNISISDSIDELNFVMKQFKRIYLDQIYLRDRNSDFPKTNAAGFIDSLMKKLQDLLSYGMDLVKYVITKEQIAEIMGHLQFFQTLLGGDNSMEFSNHGARVIDICYETEYFIDSAIHGKEDALHNFVWIYYLLQEIREIKAQVSSNQALIRNESVKNPIISRKTTPNFDEALVNLVDQEKIVIDKLIGGFKKLLTVSIVGMPGIGKTTLAKKVFNSPEVVSRFMIRAWCCASEIYRKRDVLLQILSHVIALEDIKEKTDDADLQFQLNKILMTQKFVIVFDDVWDTDVLDDLVTLFPDKEDGSRILVTSRLNDVALKAKSNADPHHLRLLSDNESWELLQKKIFGKNQCPEDVKETGKRIAASCKGLPLAIIATAGLLERIEMQHDQWNGIAQSLSSQILNDPQDQCRYILGLSYANLPECLKACYLYFGAFLEDQDIPVRKLMQLWIAEGFIPEIEFKTMEDVAEDYLMDLIGRNLVILSKQRSRVGGAKACRIHDVLRKLCQSKAKEDKFMEVITRSDASNNANLHYFDSVFSSNFRNPSSSAFTFEDHRICLSSNPKYFMESRPSGPNVRSLLCFETVEMDPRYPFENISFIYQNFRYLKVLDLECINIGNSFPQDLLLLLQLRYLAVSGYIDSVPESIAKLWNLETLILKGLRRGKVKLPHTIFRLKKLRHVCANDFAAINIQENLCQLDYLATISSLILPFGKETDYMLMHFPNLKKLKCIFSEAHQFPNLKVLSQLESLKATYYSQGVVSCGEFCFNSNLKKLTLSNFRLPWNKMSAIGQLPNLEVLKVLSRAFVGEEWEMAEGEFIGLKYLKLKNLDVSHWNANGDCLPKLQQLVLRSCKTLEIPVDIVEVSTLQIIDVQWCGESVEKSARRIRKEGDEVLKVFINFAEVQSSL